MSDKVKKTVLGILSKSVNQWVPQNIIQKHLEKDERFAPAIAKLREEGHVISNRYSEVNGKQMWSYMLVEQKNQSLPGWFCSRCNHRIDSDKMKSNTLSEKHSNNYCTSCAKSTLFVLR